MADLTITAASVVAGSDDVIYRTAGETITAGQTVYKDSVTTQKYFKADSNGVAATRLPAGIALNSAAVNQPIGILRSGAITIGATMTAGVVYYQSDTPGGICPVADLGAGEYPCIIGIATSTTVLNVEVHAAGVAL
jgi:hypothetical protein